MTRQLLSMTSPLHVFMGDHTKLQAQSLYFLLSKALIKRENGGTRNYEHFIIDCRIPFEHFYLFECVKITDLLNLISHRDRISDLG